jgi:hypothetical protein
MLIGLARTCPPDVRPSDWNNSIATTKVMGALLFSDDRVSDELKARFNDDLAEKLKGPVGPEIIRWVWSRFTPMAEGTVWGNHMKYERERALRGLP